MRSIILLIFLILLPTTTGADLGEDEVIHHYFQGLIDVGHESLQNLTYNRRGKIISVEVFNVTESLERNNIDHKLLEVSPSFKTFLESLNNVVINYNRMIDHRNVKDPQNFSIFKTSLNNVLENVVILERSLDEIEGISLKDDRGNTLRFNTSEIREDLDKILKNINRYSEKLEHIGPGKGFFIYVDRDTVYLNSKVKVYGYINYGHNLPSIILLHNNRPYVVEVRNNSFSKDLYIRTLGNHTIYGISPFGPSNKVTVRCVRIPTYIEVYPRGNLTAYLGEEINVDIQLYDYYGNTLENKTLYITYLDREYSYKTPLKLKLKLNHIYVNSSLPLDITFRGDNNYSPSKNKVYIKILKIPTYITAEYDGSSIHGTLYDFRGNLLDNKRVYLTVGNNTYSTTTENGSFRFNVSKFREGYILFKGDERYAPSSRELKYEGIIGGWSSDGYIPLLSVFTFLLLLTILELYRKRYKQIERRVEENRNPGDDTKLNILPRFYRLIDRGMFREAVILAYQLFIRSLNIKKSYTPREICRMFKGIPGIRVITEIFERTYYGDIPPTKRDIGEWERFLRRREDR